MSTHADSLEAQLLQERDALAGYILALTRDAIVTEEIFQEVALGVLQEAKKGTQVNAFLPWAREMARRRVAAHYSSEKRRGLTVQLSESLTEMVTLAFEENTQSADQNRQRQRFVLECLEGLQGRARQLIDQRYRLGQTPPQIAATLNWTVNSVHVALARARKVLLECTELKMRTQERV